MGAAHALWRKNGLPQLEDLSRELTENLFFSFREENASYKNTESFMADFLANTMCKIFSSLKIKQTLWNLIRLKRDLCLVSPFSHSLVLITGYQLHILKKNHLLQKKTETCWVLPKDSISVVPNLDLEVTRILFSTIYYVIMNNFLCLLLLCYFIWEPYYTSQGCKD